MDDSQAAECKAKRSSNKTHQGGVVDEIFVEIGVGFDSDNGSIRIRVCVPL
jgi:hypothetical protein